MHLTVLSAPERDASSQLTDPSACITFPEDVSIYSPYTRLKCQTKETVLAQGTNGLIRLTYRDVGPRC